MLAEQAPIFTDLTEAREWVYTQTLHEVFYLVKSTVRTVGYDVVVEVSCFEFINKEDMESYGGEAEFDIIESWC